MQVNEFWKKDGSREDIEGRKEKKMGLDGKMLKVIKI